MSNIILDANTAKQKEWKRSNDVAMIPDKGFTKQLKKLDDEYEVIWDCVSCKWEIWKLPKASGQTPYHVLTVQTEGMSYKDLGQHVLLKLTEYSWDRYTAAQLADYLDELDNQVQRRKMKDFSNKIEAIALDTYNLSHGILSVQVPRKYKIERIVKEDG